MLGCPNLRFKVIPHPFGGLKESPVRELARRICPELEDALMNIGASRPNDSAEVSGQARYLTIETDDELSWVLYEKELTDGLPVIAPTPERVEGMLKYWDCNSKDIFGSIPPLNDNITYEVLAANAVMAGCLPEHFPIIINALKAMLDPEFKLQGVQTTTHPVGPVIILSGPLARELKIQSGTGCMGPGFAANSCIGRAVRLILMNCGGARPGKYDKATHGQPGKYGLCFAENEEASPFTPFRTEFGVNREYTTVTVIPGEAPHNINDHGSVSADGLMRTIAGTMATTGNNNKYWNGDTFVVLSPEHAGILAHEGLTKEEVRRELHCLARVPVSIMSQKEFEDAKKMKESTDGSRPYVDYVDSDGRVAVVPTPDHIKIIVAGGEGKHSMWIPTLGMCYSITNVITNAKGEPVRTLSDFLPD